jgi:hypothetical protein
MMLQDHSPESLLAGHEAKRIGVNNADGLRRRAGSLRALAKKARDDHYILLADYISNKADRLFEEARGWDFEASSSSEQTMTGR